MKTANTMNIIALLLSLLLFVGCEKDVSDEQLRVSPEIIEIGCVGGTQQVDIGSTSGWKVVVPSNCTWVKSDRYEGEGGHRQWIKLTISKNNTEETRKATITISNRGQSCDIAITQSALSFDVTPESIDVGKDKTSKDININSNISWSAKTSDSWISLSKSSGDAGYSKITVTIAKNTTGDARTGHIEIYNHDYNLTKSVTITQVAATISVNSSSIEVGPESTTRNVTVTSDIDWTAKTSANWITLSKSSGTAGTTTLNVNIEANTLASSRTSQITVYNQDYNITKKIVVNQAASTISVSTNSIEVGPESSTQNVNITSNIPWTAKTSDSWITLSKSTGYAGTTILTINIDANTLASSRSGYVEICNTECNVSKRVNITQTAFCPELKVSHDTLNVEADAITKIITIESNISWSASVTDNWISLSKSSSSVGNDAIILTIEQNTTGIARTGYVEISNSEYNISRRINIQQNGYTLIEYTSTSQITIDSSAYFGALIESHTWNNGNGVIRFDGPVTSIGWSAFEGCSSLTSITIPDSVNSIGNWAFSGCSSLTSITIPNSVTEIRGGAFYRCSSLTSVTIPESVTHIGAWAFYDCSSLTSINIPNNVIEIGSSAFSGCNSLTSINIPNNVIEIGSSAFSGCSSLTSITIPERVTSIESYAFYDCSSLTSITIPESVTSIGNEAFYKCIRLTSVYCKATTPPVLGIDVFGWNGSGRKIYVPRNIVIAYEYSEGWSDYAWDIVGYDF